MIILAFYDMLTLWEVHVNELVEVDRASRWLLISIGWRLDIYAIIETGGKQYRVSPGQVVDVDFMDAIDGSTVELDRVLLIGDGDKVVVGKPTVEGAKVVATSEGDTRAKKVIAFRYKNKTRSHVKRGHRQLLSRLTIGEIIPPEGFQS